MTTDRRTIAARFEKHPTDGDRGPTIEEARAAYIQLALRLADRLPESLEKDRSLLTLQDSFLWAQEAISHHLTT